MKQFNLLFLILFCFTCSQLQSQDVRYLDEVFSGVTIESNVIYGTNITVVTGTPASEALAMDVYTPTGDDATDRPVIIYVHTGSFLPQYFNGQITGGKTDSTAVEICKRLARLGYVAVSATYRKGWNPIAMGAEGQNIRTGTLLNAAYRGIQDFRTCIRYLRKTVAEGNPYGIDPNKIGGWGQGTGGYITLGAAYLDRFEEVNLDKFIDTETLLPYVDTSLSGGVYGLEDRPLNIANHVEYSSDFALCINMGGALGDISWVEGLESEPTSVGFHVPSDPFAPFGNGPVIVPTTMEFVVNVSGTRTSVEAANDLGSNASLDPITDLTNELNLINEALQPVDFQFPGQEATTLATDNMFPFLTPGNRFEAGPWDWWSKPQLDATIAFVNMAFMTDFNSDTLHMDGLITNPDMSPTKAKAYIDTLMNYTVPRACATFGLIDCLTAIGVVGTEEVLKDSEVGLQIAPNPAVDQIILQTNAEHPMIDIRVFDARGLLVRSHTNIDDHNFTFHRSDMPAGIYFARIRFEEGFLTKQIVFK